MGHEIGALSELFIASRDVAYKGFQTRMGPHMGSKIEVQGKSLLADLALVMPLFGMDKFVSF